MNKRYLIALLAIISIILLAACGSDQDDSGEDENNSDATETYTIGASQIVEHPSLDAAYEGFKQAIADAGLTVEYDLQSAQGEPNNSGAIAQNFVADGVDLIFANATPSAQTALHATKEIPIVFTSVTDAIDAGLIAAMDEPGDNITGVTDMHPDAIIETVGFIEKYFAGATIGVIYNAGEQNSVTQIEHITAAIEGTDLELTERSVATSAEVQQAASSLIGDADVIYIVTDNTVVTALESVVGVANDQNIPLIVGEPDSLERGGFATFGIDYFTIGYRAGEMAVEILTGAKTTAEIDAEYPPEMTLFINKDAAEAQAIEWHSDWDEIASFQ